MGTIIKGLVGLGLILSLSACQFDIEDPEIIVNAGKDQKVERHTEVTLDASGSYHEKGKKLSFNWLLMNSPPGVDVDISNSDQVSANFLASSPGNYRFKVVASHGNSSNSDEIDIHVLNNSPIADAGNDVIGYKNSIVSLNGSNSSDPDNDTLRYQWTFVDKPLFAEVELDNDNSQSPNFTASELGDYILSLTVSDGFSESIDYIKINIVNQKPIPVITGPNQVSAGSPAQLTATNSRDSDQDDLSFVWSLISKPQTSTLAINHNGSTLNFTPDIKGPYVVQLEASDGIDTASSIFELNATNTAPAAIITGASLVAKNSLSIFSAANSYDLDGDKLSYSWHVIEQPKGSQLPANQHTQPTLQLTPEVSGSYKLILDVFDGEALNSNEFTFVVENNAPVIAGVDDLTVQRNSNVQLDATASTDANEDELSYRWILVSQPENSAIAGLNNMHEAIASFTPTVSGIYLINLHVEDGESEAFKQITVTVENTAPVAIAEFSGSLNAGERVYLDGSNSYDPDADELSYIWTLISVPEGSTASLTDYQSPTIDVLLDKQGEYTISLIVEDGENQNATEFSLYAQAEYLYRNTFENQDLSDFIVHENGTSSVSVNNGELIVTPGTGYTNGGYAALDLRTIVENYTGRLEDLGGKLIISFNVENKDLEVCGACNNSFSIGLSNKSNQMLSDTYGYNINGGGYVGNRMTFIEYAKANSVYGSLSNDLFVTSDGLAPTPSNGAFRIEFNPYSSVWSIYFEQSPTQLNANEITHKIGEFTSSKFSKDELPFLYFGGYNGSQIKFDNIQINLDKNLSDVKKLPYKLEVDTHFETTRSGFIGDNVSMVVEKNGSTVLQRNAAGELKFTYHNNTEGFYRIWLTQGGQLASNIIEYEVPTSYPYRLIMSVSYELSHFGTPINDLYWAVETNRNRVEKFDASQSTRFKFNKNVEGSYYRVWLETFDGINYERVSKAYEYNVAPRYHLSLRNNSYAIKSDRLITDNLVWMIQTYGGQPRTILTAMNTDSHTYEYNSSYIGKPLKIWLADQNNNAITRSNVIEYIVEKPKAYSITLDDSLLLTRSGSLGDGTGWMIIKNGKQALHRNASNELTYTFYNNTPDANIEAYIVKWVGTYYGRVSNIVQYSAP